MTDDFNGGKESEPHDQDSLVGPSKQLNQDLDFYDTQGTSEKKKMNTFDPDVGRGFLDQNIQSDDLQPRTDDTAMTLPGRHAPNQTSAVINPYNNSSIVESQTILEDHQQIIESKPKHQAWWD